jgi:hypothetical protein
VGLPAPTAPTWRSRPDWWAAIQDLARPMVLKDFLPIGNRVALQ